MNIYKKAIDKSIEQMENLKVGRGFDNTYNNGRKSGFETAIEILQSAVKDEEKRLKAIMDEAVFDLGKSLHNLLFATPTPKFPLGGEVSEKGEEFILNGTEKRFFAKHFVLSSRGKVRILEEELCKANERIAFQKNIFDLLKIEVGELEKWIDALVEEHEEMAKSVIEKDEAIQNLNSVMKAYQRTRQLDMENQKKLHDEISNLRSANHNQSKQIIALNTLLRSTPNVFGGKPNKEDLKYQRQTSKLNTIIALITIVVCFILVLVVHYFKSIL